MQANPDGLQKYVIFLAKILLVVGVLEILISLMIVFIDDYKSLSNLIQSVYVFLYGSMTPLTLVFGLVIYPLAFFIPALVFLMRRFRHNEIERNYFCFVLFVLLFYGLVILGSFFVPYSLS